jgi:AraC-like DNA-binding protein
LKRIPETKNSVRPKEIVRQYLFHLDKHIDDLKNGRANKTLQIKDIAGLLFIHPKHLSNTIQDVLGKSPCDLYEERLIEISKELILSSDKSISSIAQHLTFDPSNFTKFFKSYTGMTPKKFRAANQKKKV